MPKSPVAVKKKINVGDLVRVDWQDACTRGGWKAAADYISTVPIDVSSVGWLLVDAKTHVTLIQTVSGEQISDSMTIPKPWIRKMKQLR